MKLNQIIFKVLIILITINLFVFSQEKNKTNREVVSKSDSKVVKQVETKKIWNAYCPVMGEPVDPEVQTVEYKGKIIGFCCKSCIKKFKKDPEKYLKNLSEDGQKFIKQKGEN